MDVLKNKTCAYFGYIGYFIGKFMGIKIREHE